MKRPWLLLLPFALLACRRQNPPRRSRRPPPQRRRQRSRSAELLGSDRVRALYAKPRS